MRVEILFRAAIAIGIGLMGYLSYRLVSRRVLDRAERAAEGLSGLKPGIPAILYFTTPDCQPCKTTQRPALAQLKQQLGDGLQVLQVDASIRKDLAEHWGVLSVPTTFVVDSQGQPRRVNHGVALADQLRAQIEEVELAIHT